jgi:hypothetical protein
VLRRGKGIEAWGWMTAYGESGGGNAGGRGGVSAIGREEKK